MLVFRLPGEADFKTINFRKDGECSLSFTTFEGREALHFRGDFVSASAQDFLDLQAAYAKITAEAIIIEVTPAEYHRKILQAKTFLQLHQAEKLVLSRRKIQKLPQGFSVAKSVQQMAKAYPEAFVYAVVEEDQAWMGGFSEILGKYNVLKQDFQTVSLAGTVPLSENWTEKEYAEQATVTNYILGILETMATKVCVGKVQEVVSGKIKHLKTDFSAKVPPEAVAELLKKLHPTPAVCGIPKMLCQQKIAELEGQSRGLYAGYITVKAPQLLTAFVNLRCTQLFKSEAVLYVGGGLNSASDPEKEWRETELKAFAVLDNLVTSEN